MGQILTKTKLLHLFMLPSVFVLGCVSIKKYVNLSWMKDLSDYASIVGFWDTAIASPHNATTKPAVI